MAHKNCNQSHGQSQQFENYSQSAFSFQSKSHQMHYRPTDKPRTIEKYLRLKTNQSIEDKFSAQQSTQQHNEKKYAGKRRNSVHKSFKNEEVQSSSIQYHKNLMQQEYELRIQSLIKQFQLKFNKQEDYCKLIQWKYKQQIDNLNQQIHILQESKKRSKRQSKTLLSSCSICSDGQVITHLKNIIKEVESTHQFCLSNKKQLTKQFDEARNKFQILQSEHEKLQGQFKQVNKQLRASNNDNLKFQQENEVLKNEMAKLKMQLAENNQKMRAYKQYHQNYEHRYKESKNKNIMLQNQLMSKQEDLHKISKTALLPLSSSVLTSIQNNENSSCLRPRDSHSKHKNSISKIYIEDLDLQDKENFQYYKKIQDNCKGNNSQISSNSISNQRIQNLKWKYF